MITCPREGPEYMTDTLKSLLWAGWPEVTIFAEPGSPEPTEAPAPWNPKYTMVRRRKQFGDWTNWATGLYELLLTEPDTDYFMMLEDDIAFCKDVRDYLDYALPLLGDFATVSFYTPEKYNRTIHGFHNECRDWKTWTTQTVIMTREGASDFFAFKPTQEHRFQNVFDPSFTGWGCRNPQNSCKDAILGKWAYAKQLPMYFHSPSLAQHTGTTSTLRDESMPGDHLSDTFLGEDVSVKDWAGKDVDIRRFRDIPI
jgi:hypothetical protein